ncbi:hypothetical protein [Halomicronema sp. CCY15110]|uniref:hypothetical protein n=1 Tax=Halomicronema sp. CCY15110 TaxID=2767773 RepID=UPI00194F47B6|nr:hypothetical protein [Halomicronema sp. CCY15110]
MRVYTNPALRHLVSYAKLFVGLTFLAVLLFQAAKIWGNDPTIQDIKNLVNTEQTEQP